MSLPHASQPCRTGWRALVTRVPFVRSFLPSFLCWLFLPEALSSLCHCSLFSFLLAHLQVTTRFLRSSLHSLSLSLSLAAESLYLISLPLFIHSCEEPVSSLGSFFHYRCLLCAVLRWSRGQFSLCWGCQWKVQFRQRCPSCHIDASMQLMFQMMDGEGFRSV